MGKFIKDMFDNNKILESIAKIIGVEVDSLVLLKRGFQSFVFRGHYENKETIIKVTHNSHRQRALIESEIDFIKYLAESGVSVADSLRFPNGNYTEIIDLDESYFTVSLFEFSNGLRAKIAEEKSEFYQCLGEIVGRVHTLSKKYKPIQIKRPEWNENNSLRQFKQFVPDSLHKVHERFDSIILSIEELRKSNDSYGLIHGDIYPGNYLNENGKVRLIDFDRCEYSWFVSDIAMPLFYETPIPWVVDGEKRKNIALRFFNNFMEGYHKTNSIDSNWLKSIPLFIDLRQVVVISTIYRSYDFCNYEDWKQWDKEALKFYINNLETNNDYINIKF
ncbi:phosphotransferase enzyme family protein [Paenibacillus piri]|uniref:Protein kinase domain-containing protein n=1 Tax=Paenibacillus piri TaxID=2547395 RepID=A0A4V2ZRV9_9BACL|nr:phosphotransferase [Paenibacillus piri]TDF90539.1 hypothetical protein E1757_34100 [Paenibacillus piri]